MKVAFLSSLNPYDINNWSGTLYYIFHTLRKTHCVEWIGGDIIEEVKKEHFLNCKNIPFILELYSSRFAEIISDRLRLVDEYDIVLARDCFFIAYLKINIPIVYIGDTTFDLIKESWGITNKQFIRLLDDIEKKAFLNADSIIFSSKWAKENTVSHYGVSPSLIEVIEFGANLSSIPSIKDSQILDNDTCNLLFIGKDWERKGGDKAYETFKILKNNNFKCKLTIIGSIVDLDKSDLDLMVIPLIDKSKERDIDLLIKVMEDTHFFILPTNFDCFGMVFCEASAYGIPSITADVGGVSQVVHNGKNGYLLSPEALPQEYADLIKTLFQDKKEYQKLRQSSRKEFEIRLNWNIWSEKINLILKQFERHIYKEKKDSDHSDFYIPTYIVNLKNRSDRKKHIEKQFQDKSEFKIHFIEAIEHSKGTIGLWKSIKLIIQTAIERNDDIILFCEDDHVFTEFYSKEILFQNIITAEKQGAELLLGGISGFGTAVPTTHNLYWVDWYWGNQFIVIFEPLFQRIVDYKFKEDDMADLVLSSLTANKMVIYPFISIQKEFGYSDINKLNETPGYVNQLFTVTKNRLSIIHGVNQYYNYKNEF